MKSDINVVIIEDDIYSLNWMSLLLVRDWRTRVIEEISTQGEFIDFLNQKSLLFNLILVDMDSINKNFDLREACQAINNLEGSFKIICVGCRPDENAFAHINPERFGGYILKQEIGYSLGWAISFAMDGKRIFTASTISAARKIGLQIPENSIVLQGRSRFPGITEHESEVARLAIIFSLGRRDLADELKISDQWSYGLVSGLYSKLGLEDVLSGDVDVSAYLGDSPILKNHIDEIMTELGTSKKAKDLETLAFHLLTMPEFVD